MDASSIGILFILLYNNFLVIMETRTTELSLEDAIDLYKLGGNYKNIALRAYTEDELINLPKTWEEFCRTNKSVEEEWLIADNSEPQWVNIKNRDPERNANLLETRYDAEAHLALIKLHRLRDCYRNGWIPNWTDDSNKAVIYIKDGFPTVGIATHIGTFLSFQSPEIAEDFLSNFKHLIYVAEELI